MHDPVYYRARRFSRQSAQKLKEWEPASAAEVISRQEYAAANVAAEKIKKGRLHRGLTFARDDGGKGLIGV